MSCCCCRGRPQGGATTLWIVRASNGEVLWRRPRYQSETNSFITSAVHEQEGHYLTERNGAGGPFLDDLDPQGVPLVRIRETIGGSVAAYTAGPAYPLEASDGTRDYLYYLATFQTGVSAGWHYRPLLYYRQSGVPGAAFATFRYNQNSETTWRTNGVSQAVYRHEGLIPPEGSRYYFQVGEYQVWDPDEEENVNRRRSVVSVDATDPDKTATWVFTDYCIAEKNVYRNGQFFFRDGKCWSLTWEDFTSDTMFLRSYDAYSGSKDSEVEVTGLGDGYRHYIWVTGSEVWCFSNDRTELFRVELDGTASAISMGGTLAQGNGPIGGGPADGFVCDDDSFVFQDSLDGVAKVWRYEAGGSLAYAITVGSARAWPYTGGEVVIAHSSAVRLYSPSGVELWSLPGANLSTMQALPDGLILMAGFLPA